MPIDKVKSLKIEDPALGGTETDFGPREIDPSEDHLSAKGVAFENSDDTVVYGDSGVMKFKDTEITAAKTLKDAMERLKYKDVDLTNLTTGYVLTWNNTLNKFELLAVGSASGGVTPPFIFSKSGNASAGTYLRTGEAVTSATGQTIKGNNLIVEISVSNANVVGTNTVVQIRRRTALSTFSDVVGASVTIPSGNYKATNSSLTISFGPDEEMSAYVKSGSTLSNPVLVVYLTPA